MIIKVATIFPEMFSTLDIGILGKAKQKGLLDLQIVNIRDYSTDKHKKTDDAPFGGGAGMVMTPQPLHDAITALDGEHKAKRIYLSPKGATLNQETVERLAKEDELLLVCGSYEGIDERIIEMDIDEEISIGDYVLTGGELPAMVLINAVSRYVDGVLGSSESTSEESFVSGLLEYPQYTRPAVFEGMAVPEVLLSGNHAEIAKWRYQKQIEITRQRRDDLYQKILPALEKEKKTDGKKESSMRYKNAIEQLLDEENDETVYLKSDVDESIQAFEQMALIAYDKKLYAILVRKEDYDSGNIENAGLVFEVDEKRQKLDEVTDDNIIFEVFDLYDKMFEEGGY